jgi:hypothetical protein
MVHKLELLCRFDPVAIETLIPCVVAVFDGERKCTSSAECSLRLRPSADLRDLKIDVVDARTQITCFDDCNADAEIRVHIEGELVARSPVGVRLFVGDSINFPVTT